MAAPGPCLAPGAVTPAEEEGGSETLAALQVEAYYRSSAAGSARITLGNRRWGENGYVAAGRMRARPVQPVPSKVGWGATACCLRASHDP